MMQQLNASTAIVKAMLKSKDLFVFHSGTRAWDKRMSVVGVTKGTQTVLKVTGGFLYDFDTSMQITLSDFVGMEEANGQEVYVDGVDAMTNELTISLNSSTFSDYQYGGLINYTRDFVNESENLVEIRRNISGMKRVTADDMVAAIQRRNWTKSHIYSAYSSIYPQDAFEYTVFIEDTLFVCLASGGGESKYEPMVNDYKPLVYPDGYTWMAVQTISESDASKFLTENWVPVRNQFSGTSDESSVLAISVDNPGSGYVHTDKVVIIGDGEGATAYVDRFTTEGGIKSIAMDNFGTGYTWATAYINRQSDDPVSLFPFISSGIMNADLISLLRARHIRISTEHRGSEGEMLHVGSAERVVGLCRAEINDDVFDNRIAVTFNELGHQFSVGEEVEGSISRTKGIISHIEKRFVKITGEEGTGFVPGELIASNLSSAVSTKISRPTSKLRTVELIGAHNYSEPNHRDEYQLDRYQFTLGF